MPKFRNDERFLLVRNALYKFCQIHNLTVTIKGNEQTHLITFIVEDGKNENKRN